MTQKEIPVKNYIKLGIIVLLTLISCLIIYIIYNNNKKYEGDVPLLRNKVSEIEYDDVDDYINDNNTVLLYFGVVHDDNSEKIEEGLIKSIDKDNIEFVYVNITNLKTKTKYFENFNNKYGTSIKKITNYPAFVYIKDKKIEEIVQRDDRYLEMNDISQMMEVIGEQDD